MVDRPPLRKDRWHAILAASPGSPNCGYGVCPRGPLAAGRATLSCCRTSDVVDRPSLLGLRVDEYYDQQRDNFDEKYSSDGGRERDARPAGRDLSRPRAPPAQVIHLARHGTRRAPSSAAWRGRSRTRGSGPRTVPRRCPRVRRAVRAVRSSHLSRRRQPSAPPTAACVPEVEVHRHPSARAARPHRTSLTCTRV